MKTLTSFILTVACVLGLGARLHSQAPAAPKTPLQQLQDIKKKNAEQIEKQGGALQKLDALQQDAVQLKFLGKRT